VNARALVLNVIFRKTWMLEVLVVGGYFVTEPPKLLGPPTVVLVQRTSDNPIGAPELLDKFGICFSYLSQGRFSCHADITDHQRYGNAEAITKVYLYLKVGQSYIL
jgi:hypothetical protein